MAENLAIKERLLSFVKSLNITKAEFERRTNLSNGYLRNFKGNLGADKLEGILNEFPMLSRSWLLAGEGEMLRSAEKNDVPAEVEPQPSPSEMLAAIVAKLDTLEKRLADECAQRDRLMGIVENQQNLIAKLAEVGVMEKTI